MSLLLECKSHECGDFSRSLLDPSIQHSARTTAGLRQMVKKKRSFDESVSGWHIQGGFSSSLRSVVPNLTLVWRTVRPSGPQSTPSSSQGHTKAQLGRCQTSRRIIASSTRQAWHTTQECSALELTLLFCPTWFSHLLQTKSHAKLKTHLGRF